MKIAGQTAAWIFVLGATAGEGDAGESGPNRLARESSPYLRLHAANPVYETAGTSTPIQRLWSS